jgi:hypothetical protein
LDAIPELVPSSTPCSSVGGGWYDDDDEYKEARNSWGEKERNVL